MATVTLYFEAYPGEEAASLRIEESVDGQSWSEVEVVDEIGEYPTWISTYTTDDAASADNWFRIRWELESGQFTPFSPPVHGPAIPPRWTVPGVYRNWTRLDTVKLTDSQIQSLVDRAYFRLQEECGPYDVTHPEFAERAQLAIHIYLDQLLLLTNPETQRVLAGYLEEQKGSYRYRRSDKAIDLLLSDREVPLEVKSLVCPFAVNQGGAFAITTTKVFDQAELYTQDDGVKEYVYTDDLRVPQLAGIFFQPFQTRGYK